MSTSGASAFRVDVIYDLFLNQERPFMLQYLVGIGAIVVHFLASSELSGLVGLSCVPSVHTDCTYFVLRNCYDKYVC
jgi:hypothetical protein